MNNLQQLKAGPFTVGYMNGAIRHIRYGSIEVLRSIYPSLRGEHWITYDHQIENEMIDRHDNHFMVEYDCFYIIRGKRSFEWHVSITGDITGTITFEIKGKALAEFIRNRAGLCVLHPIKFTAGNPCELLQSDGAQIKKIFPAHIASDNPFKDLMGFRWRCHHDWYRLTFEGDEFETEDQRNWSDASYKTFCTPLSKPFPIQLNVGDTVYQKVIFKPESDLLPIPESPDETVEILALEKRCKLPAIGINASTETETLSDAAIQKLRDLNLQHYRIDVAPSSDDWISKFGLDTHNAKELGLPLKIVLHISTTRNKELEKFYLEVLKFKPIIHHILLLSTNLHATDASLIHEITSLKRHFPDVAIGAGTDFNFRELNCNLFDADQIDFISYSIDPQQHASDDLTIIENIAAQGDTVTSARSIYGDEKDVHISSLTLKSRYNPAATGKERVLSNEAKSDPRQKTDFAAAFLVGSLKSLSQASATAVTLFQTVGNQGILSADGDPYPVYAALEEILSDPGADVIHTSSTHPLRCDALLLHSSGQYKLILVNYTSSSQRVSFRKDHYVLKPYEVVCVNIL